VVVIHGAEIEGIASPGGHRTSGLATPSRGASQVSLIRQVQQPGGQGPLHTHDREELILLERGSISVAGTETTAELQAGDLLVIPAGAAHQIRNTGSVPAEWLLVAPAGIRYYGVDGAEVLPAWAE
jgi:quercetin dioxygenase-like cupin family protein